MGSGLCRIGTGIDHADGRHRLLLQELERILQAAALIDGRDVARHHVADGRLFLNRVRGTYDAIIIGVSGDPADRHAAFREKHALPFPLIADPDGKLRERYDAKGWIPWMPPRVTYVIDKEGVIRAALRHDFRVTAHVPEVLEALAKFAAPAGPDAPAATASG
ncbi:MAG: peroxiredoxin [Dehalococcoidia bacterium]|nr:peroxiredoxin [Dehalococcoidia bacterium]